MSSQNKIRLANVLIAVGLAPLALGFAWIGSVVSWAQQHKGQAGGSDAFLMMGVFFVTYLFAFIVSGGGALWSAILAKRNKEIRTGKARILRWFYQRRARPAIALVSGRDVFAPVTLGGLDIGMMKNGKTQNVALYAPGYSTV